MLQWLYVFAILFALDWIYAKYTKAVGSGHPAMAGVLAAGIISLTGIATVSYVADHWLLIPAALGAFCGTWVAMRKKS